MKKTTALLLCLAVLLCGCTNLKMLLPPEEVSFEGKTYATGFYENLVPADFQLLEEEGFTHRDILFRRVEHKQFILYHAHVGGYTSGALYCEKSQYAEAAAYYSDPDNFSYYCAIGVNDPSSTVELTGVDPVKFDALLAFTDVSVYLPFNIGDDRKNQTVELPIPDNDVTPRLFFYKDSKDQLFTTVKNIYYILDNTLYLVYYYDYEGDGKLVAVPVPEDLSDYFVEYMKAY